MIDHKRFYIEVILFAIVLVMSIVLAASGLPQLAGALVGALFLYILVGRVAPYVKLFGKRGSSRVDDPGK